MTTNNVMKHFITEEGGTTSLLATVLDPELEYPGQIEFWKAFSTRLGNAGVSLPDVGPGLVKREYLGIDLVMVWGEWVVLLENKISAASVTRHQLQKHYNEALKKLARGTFLGIDSLEIKHVALVYLTPTADIGNIEFESLYLDSNRQDSRVHLSWEDVLQDLDKVIENESTNDPGLIHYGVELTQGLLKANAERAPKIKETRTRIGMKKFIYDVEKRIGDIMQSEPSLRLYMWRDLAVDELYGSIEGRNLNVTIDLWEEGSELPAGHVATVNATVYAKVANKAPTDYKQRFDAFPLDYWATMLALDSRDLISDANKHMVSVNVHRSGIPSDLVNDMAALFCRFLITSRPFMIEK